MYIHLRPPKQLHLRNISTTNDLRKRLSEKQWNNYVKATNKALEKEQLRQQYPPYEIKQYLQTRTLINYQTSIEELNTIIYKKHRSLLF
ncbi:unnamed protein product [Didymodactylos carnosus]|uniref:Uncharacterized protein n=2 Tax=Didymodactylos carnosus TaxID=1234261 RepID=A0A816EU07_9BILA|nr:unnamed protein product [Didymodactylos carnosus]CAF4588122.1 unnamed protein product [Didymodactylos carnosus]